MNDQKPQPSIADENVERLIRESYLPESPDADFAARVEQQMLAASQGGRRRESPPAVAPSPLGASQMTIGWGVAIALMIAVIIWGNFRRPVRAPGISEENIVHQGDVVWIDGKAFVRSDAEPLQRGREGENADLQFVGFNGEGMRFDVSSCRVACESPSCEQPEAVQVGDTIATAARQQQRLTLPDGSVLYVDENTSAKLTADRRLEVTRGEVFVEVAPKQTADQSPETFRITTPRRTVTALGTKFGVRAGESDARVLVTQGKVQVSDTEKPLSAGQQLLVVDQQAVIAPAPRADVALGWMRDLVVAAEGALIPANEKAGGELIAVDPEGQDAKLSLRKYHIDVHIEDGFARTTIDQTYFNHMWSRLEGTFYFPLPPDASLSRLAMYVGPNLMEGGMAERDYARQVFETIKTRKLDPALLEWVDGSTFKMRVFPLEPRQEKRIILSYTQKLDISYGRTRYRFPAGHNMKVVGQWSARITAKEGARLRWDSPSHEMKAATDGRDLVLSTEEEMSRLDRDVLLFLNDDSVAQSRSAVPDDQTREPAQPSHVSLSATQHEGSNYLMLRWRPELPIEATRQRRDWVFLFETSADRDPLLARTQIEIVRTILNHAEHDDTFAIVTAGAYTDALAAKPRAAVQQNIDEAIEYLDNAHLVGALDLEQAFRSLETFTRDAENPTIVHIGSGVPILGERETGKLVQALPTGAEYVGVGVGKRFNRSLMKQAAAQTGGYFTQINPDESTSWRGFELVSALNTPRLLDVKIATDSGACEMLALQDSLSHGEELCAIARYQDASDEPNEITITGQLNGQPLVNTVPVAKVEKSTGPLPRMWAKQKIELLTTLGAEGHKDEIIQLSKAMYVMSPFTSLLVLENEEMYEQYKIDRGRKDHWALYPAPETIEVVEEKRRDVPVADDEEEKSDEGERKEDDEKPSKPSVDDVLNTIAIHQPAPVLRMPGYGYRGSVTTSVLQALNVAYAWPYDQLASMPIKGAAHWFGPVGGGGYAGTGNVTHYNVNINGVLPTSNAWYLSNFDSPPDATLPSIERLYGMRTSNSQLQPLRMMLTPRFIIQEEDRRLLDIGDFRSHNNLRWTQEADFDALIDLITSTVQPSTWNEVSGPGQVEAFPGNLSLVISQNQRLAETTWGTIPAYNFDGRAMFGRGGSDRVKHWSYELPLAYGNTGAMVFGGRPIRNYAAFFEHINGTGGSFEKTWAPHRYGWYDANGDGYVGRDLWLDVPRYWDRDQSLLDEFLTQEREFLDEIENSKALSTEIIEAEVELAVAQSREQMGIDPEGAIAELKVLLENVERSPDLDGRLRAEVRNRIVSEVKLLQRRLVVAGERDQVRAEREAVAALQGRTVSSIVERFNSLMDEHRFDEATAVAGAAARLHPNDDIVSTMLWKSRFVRRVRSGSYRLPDVQYWRTEANGEGTELAALQSRMPSQYRMLVSEYYRELSEDESGRANQRLSRNNFTDFLTSLHTRESVDRFRRYEDSGASRLLHRDFILGFDEYGIAPGQEIGWLRSFEGIPRERRAPWEIEPSMAALRNVEDLIAGIQDPEVVITVDREKARTINYKRPISRFSVTNHSVLGVNQKGDTELELVGRKPGVTTLTLWYPGEESDPEVLRYVVRVPPGDVDNDAVAERFKNYIREARSRRNKVRTALAGYVHERVSGRMGQRDLFHQRAHLTSEHELFGRLVSYAPGLNTSPADIYAVLESEADIVLPVRGQVDAGAKQLIDRARARPWQSVTWNDEDGQPAFTLIANGQGQYRYQHRTRHGLLDTVVCDGKTLEHHYEEIGLGARRDVSRFHRAALPNMVPWAVLPVGDLAVGADVRLVAADTVAIVPLYAECFDHVETQLVFADDGRLRERRLVAQPQHKVLRRVTYSPDGVVKWHSGVAEDDGKPLHEMALTVKSIAAPNLKPDRSQLVMLPMPARTRDHVFQTATWDEGQTYESLSQEDALRLLAADMHINPGEKLQVIGRCFAAKGDRRVGFYTLALSAGDQWNPATPLPIGEKKTVVLDPLKDHPNSRLAEYIASQVRYRRDGLSKDPPVIEGAADGFVQQLGEFRRQYVRLSTGRAQDRNNPDAKAFARSRRLLESLHSPELQWEMLRLLKEYYHGDVDTLFVDAYERLTRDPVLGYLARYEYGRALYGVGEHAKSRAVFTKWYEETLAAGVLPRIDTDFRDAMRSETEAHWRKLILDAAGQFADTGRRPTAITLATQVQQLGDTDLGNEALALALAGVDEEDRFAVSLAGVEYLWASGQQRRALELVQPLLADEQYAQLSVLWRLASTLAQQQGMTARSAKMFEQALEIEYGSLTSDDVVNLQQLRTDYGELLTRYAELATALASLEEEPSPVLLSRIVGAADRWRSMEDDVGLPCNRAAQIFGALGADRLAWQYVTTPLSARPNEAAPWLDLAASMRDDHNFAMADRAYREAFRSEGTNAEILWNHAEMFTELGRHEEARRLHQQIAETDWQPRFQHVKQKAKQVLGKE